MVRKLSAFLSIALLALFSCLPVAAQVNSNVTTVALSMNVNESLTVVAGPASIPFTYTAGSGSNPGSATTASPITVTTTWNFQSSHNYTINVSAWLSDPVNALVAGSNSIPASAIFASIGGGTAAACTGTTANVVGAVSGATCPMIYSNNSGTPTGTHNSTIQLSMPSFSPAAGAYSGTLTIAASAF